MRILQINTEKTWRGGERQTLLTVEALLQRGLEVDILCMAGKPLASRAALLKGLGLQQVSSHTAALEFLLRNGRRYDLLHAQTAKAQSLAVLAKPVHRRPLVYTRRVDFVPKGLVTKYKYRRTDKVAAISQAISRILADFGVQSEVIPSVYKPVTASAGGIERLHKDLVLEPERRIIATAAAFVPHKDPLNMVRAMAELSRLRDDFLVLHFGEGELKLQAQKLVQGLGISGIYRFPGFVDPLTPYFGLMDVFVMSSRQEGLGSVVLEAFHHGVPVASTRAGGLSDLVEGRGLLAPIENPKALALAVNELLNKRDMAVSLSRKAREYVDREHDPGAAAAKYIQIYNSLVS